MKKSWKMVWFGPFFFIIYEYVWSFWAIWELNRINCFQKQKWKRHGHLIYYWSPVTEKHLGWENGIETILIAKIIWQNVISKLSEKLILENSPQFFNFFFLNVLPFPVGISHPRLNWAIELDDDGMFALNRTACSLSHRRYHRLW